MLGQRGAACVEKSSGGSGRLRSWVGPLCAELALATRSEPFSAAGWLYELKYDGFRVLAAKEGPTITLRLRSGRDATRLLPEVVDALALLQARRALLDGELVVFGSDGRSDFEGLRRRVLQSGRWREPAEHVRACFFDLLSLDGWDLRQLSVVERKRRLGVLLSDQNELVYVDHVRERGDELLAGARKLGLEGIVAKKADSAYTAGRSSVWRKIKVEETSDFVVIGIAEPTRETFMRPGLLLARVDGGRVRHVGRVAIGGAELAALKSVVRALGRKSAPCSCGARAVAWLEPALVCEVRYLAASRRGLRHAVFIRFRPDKPWRECSG